MTSGREVQGQDPSQSLAGLREPEGEPYAEVHETHSGVVVLVGGHAYKFKKPVDLGFLDFTTLARRSAACRRELELNRRLAPDVYEGLGEVRDDAGRVIEHLVLMRRMPAARRLAALVSRRVPVDTELSAIARMVAGFHAHCDSGPAVAADGTRDAVAERWRRNVAESYAFRARLLPEDSFDAVVRMAARFLEGRAPLFAERIARGAVVDGHGDLLADDIFCLPDGPRILDCLDFDDSLRHLDRVDDVACLMMDLERLGNLDAARTFGERYLEFSGDRAPAALLDHYIAYRAFMRAKVTCLRDRAESASQARRLLAIASRHLDDSRVALVLVGGAPGTGKTTAGSGLADAVGAVLVSSDRVRKELAGLPADTSRSAAFRHGIYDDSWTERTYQELLRRAELLLSMGETVVLDATWADRRHRLDAAALAERTSSDLVQLRCEAPEDVAEQRLRSRRGGPSDADAEIARRVRAGFDVWPEADTVLTSGPLADTVMAMRRSVRPRDQR